MTIQIFSAILLPMTIERACSRDLDRIMEIYRDCTEILQGQGIHQWTEHYPSRDIVSQDISRGDGYAAKDPTGRIIGVVAADTSPPDEAHRDVPWLEDSNPSVSISRLAVDPSYQGKGIGTNLFEYAETRGILMGAASLRLDVDAGNTRLVAMYAKRGYAPRGSVWYDDPPKEFYAMEKCVPEIDIHWASDEELPRIFEIRDRVFIEGQHVARELEQDGLDDEAKHVILYESKKPVGCARIRWMSMELEGEKSRTLLYWKVERLAVHDHARRKGYGKLIMEWIISKGKDQGIDGLTLHAQKYLKDFYLSLGFTAEGNPFMEAGIQHITMKRNFSNLRENQS